MKNLIILPKNFSQEEEKWVERNINRISDCISRVDFCILSSTKDENTEEENELLNEEVLKSIKEIGLKAFSLTGLWDNEITENFYLIPRNIKFNIDEFYDKIIELCEKYEQDSVILVCRDTDQCGIYDVENKKFSFLLNNITISELEKAYSIMRKKDNVFVFESYFYPECISFGKQSYRDAGYLW